MNLRPASVLTVLLFSVLSQGCGHLTPPTQTVVISPPYLPSAYRCQPAPQVPGEDANDTDLAVFMAQLWGAWDDCRGQLEAVGEDMESWAARK